MKRPARAYTRLGFVVFVCVCSVAWLPTVCFATEPGRPNVGELYRVEQPEPLVQEVFPLNDWNMLSDDSGAVPNHTAGWSLASEAPRFLPPAEDFLLRLRSDIETKNDELRRDGTATTRQVATASGQAAFSWAGDELDRHLYVGVIKRQLDDGTAFSARLMMKSDGVGLEHANELDDELCPSGVAQVGVRTNVGSSMRVWGEFRINDWNGLRGNATDGNVAPQIVTASATALDDSGGVSPLSQGHPGSFKETVSMEFGAAFVGDNGLGAVRYRRSLDDGSGGDTPVERQHLGFEGHVDLQESVRLKAGYEKILSTSGPHEQEESNIWTGIEINF